MSLTPHAVAGVELFEWQASAVSAWRRGDGGGPWRGTLEIFTGGGKSLIALECLRLAAEEAPGLRAVVVVPTLALARQWRRLLLERTGLTEQEVGRLDGERKDDLSEKQVVIAVLNSAAEHLPGLARSCPGPLMLIVDECHRAGAPRFSKVLDTPASFRLGLSATAEREDLDEDGQPIDYDDHVLGTKLGRIVYRFDLRAAREARWLPDYTVHHHAVELSAPERRRYEEVTRRIDDLADQLRAAGVEASGARQAAGRPGDTGVLARTYVGAVASRKDLLYRAAERARVVERVLERLAEREQAPRVLLFHERIEQAVALHEGLVSVLAGLQVGLEHSRMPEQARRAALAGFADGSVPVLVSVKSLVEGIDVPDADVGVSVASSSSVRQRVQALGRVLRRRFDGTTKVAEMHVIYVHESVDEAIYAKEDWSDLTGEAANVYHLWRLGVPEPEALPGPPRTPRPTEEQAWEALGRAMPDAPVLWEAEWPQAEWRLDSRGNVTDVSKRPVVNPQGAAAAVGSLKPSGGRFRVSAKHRLLVVPDVQDGQVRAWLVGRLDEPFRVAEVMTDPSNEVEELQAPMRESAGTGGCDGGAGPGSAAALLSASLDRAGGSYHLRQKRGGVIERRTGSTRVFAGTRPGEGPPELVDNAVRVLDAWRRSGGPGMQFHVSSDGTAYYVADGSAHVLAKVPGGFAWPD